MRGGETPGEKCRQPDQHHPPPVTYNHASKAAQERKAPAVGGGWAGYGRGGEFPRGVCRGHQVRVLPSQIILARMILGGVIQHVKWISWNPARGSPAPLRSGAWGTRCHNWVSRRRVASGNSSPHSALSPATSPSFEPSLSAKSGPSR